MNISSIGFYKFSTSSSLSKEYIGAYPALNGEKGNPVKGCTSWYDNEGCASEVSNVWGVGFSMPGGLFKLGISSPLSPGGNSSSKECYFRGAWTINSNANQYGQLDQSVAFSQMSQTASYNSWSKYNIAVVTAPLIINKRCSEITREWLLESGTELIIPASGMPVYANVSNPSRYSGSIGPPSGMQNGTADFLHNSRDVWFNYTGLICTSEDVHYSTCIQSYMPKAVNIGTVNDNTPVIPKECQINGNNVIEMGSVAKNNYLGVSGKTDLNIWCNADTTAMLQLINEKVSKDGIDIKMAIDKQGIKKSIPLKGNQSAQFSIDAEIISIAKSTPPGEYEMNNVLLVSYN